MSGLTPSDMTHIRKTIQEMIERSEITYLRGELKRTQLECGELRHANDWIKAEKIKADKRCQVLDEEIHRLVAAMMGDDDEKG